MADNLTKKQRKKNMKRIKSKDTSIELIMRRELWKRGYRYRKNYRGLPGTPDIVITKHKIAIFCDSEFFHGNNWDSLKIRLQNSNNSDYWINKISRNIERDTDNDKKLRFLEYEVLHFWGNDIIKHLDDCIACIEETIQKIKFKDEI